LTLALAACGDERAPIVVVADAGPPPIDGGTTRACEPVLGEPELDLELVASGFDKPVHVITPPGDARLFVLEQHAGRVRIVADGSVLPTPFLDIGDEVAKAMEQGLLSLAFHPRFAENRRFYLTYTRVDDDALVLEEWQVSSTDPDRADPSTRRQVLAIPQGTNFHHAGRVAFGPDGYLYLGHGDGGPQHDPDGHTQDMTLLLGKFLRIDVDGRDGDLGYAIPADNPFVDVAGARPEIYALGVRNPWGWSIDPATGNLYFGDVGLAQFEEIDVLPAGAGGQNFGWPVLMGNACQTPGCDPTPYTPPVYSYAYANLQLCAVIGGHVYRGCRMPGYHGRYFFGDFCAGFLRSFRWSALDSDPVQVTEHTSLAGRIDSLSGIGLDANGELLLLDYDQGTIQRVVPKP
jgi:glucose/arabinose dehydrogenase